MIGVLAKPADRPAVEEFFQLFKTPWEFVQPGCAYEVVLAAVDEVPELEAELILSYGSGATTAEQEMNASAAGQRTGVSVKYAGREWPLYGAVRTFVDAGAGVLRVAGSGESAGIKVTTGGVTRVRLGYDLFAEVARLLSAGQPAEQALAPTLELHIRLLRDCILQAGLGLVEIPPLPAGKEFIVCLTHDIDFFGLRNHRCDHTLFGFLYRASAGALFDFIRGRSSPARLARNWLAVLKTPLVHLGWAKDFWLSFDWYLNVEAGLPATYFFIPFKGCAGKEAGARRAAPYDVADHRDWLNKLSAASCEIGVHGIDAWHDPAKGRAELAKITGLTGQIKAGIRMHWLFQNDDTPRALDQAGYEYDSTAGYNETVGYRCGTVQVFRPLAASALLELPLHIQDGALFYPGRLGLSEAEAWQRCQALLGNAREFGGVLTLLWHDRSPGPERLWGDFYARLLTALRQEKVWFASAAQAVRWFQSRRKVCFERAEGDTLVARRGGEVRVATGKELPPLRLRVHSSGKTASPSIDFPWVHAKDINLADLETDVAPKPTEAAALPIPA